MDKRTSDALEGSIKHWEENVAADTPYDASTYADSCALCGAFQGYDFDCEGCPVSARANIGMCSETPYVDADAALKFWKLSPNESCKQAWRTAAQAELDFLISLREP